jgi:hypothetical protein
MLRAWEAQFCQPQTSIGDLTAFLTAHTDDPSPRGMQLRTRQWFDTIGATGPFHC